MVKRAATFKTEKFHKAFKGGHLDFSHRPKLKKYILMIYMEKKKKRIEIINNYES